MTSPGYVRGVAALAFYIGVDAKTARKILRRITIPAITIPGVVRPTTLFRLSDVDAALDQYRQETPAPPASVDIDGLIEEIVGKAKGAVR